MTLLILHEMLCLAMIATVFIRAVKMDERVRPDVHLVFVALGGLACYGLAAPLVGVLDLSGYVVVTELVFLAVQAVTSYHWRTGVPECLLKPEHICHRRRVSDIAEAR